MGVFVVTLAAFLFLACGSDFFISCLLRTHLLALESKPLFFQCQLLLLGRCRFLLAAFVLELGLALILRLLLQFLGFALVLQALDGFDLRVHRALRPCRHSNAVQKNQTGQESTHGDHRLALAGVSTGHTALACTRVSFGPVAIRIAVPGLYSQSLPTCAELRVFSFSV